jgi:hypothetical protein
MKNHKEPKKIKNHKNNFKKTLRTNRKTMKNHRESGKPIRNLEEH